MVAEEGLEPPTRGLCGGGTRTPDTRIMIKLLQLFIFYLSCLQAHKLGVLKSV